MNGLDGVKAAVVLFVAAILQVSIFTQVSATKPFNAVGLKSFEGPGLGMPGFVIVGAPPDPTMAVGPGHVVAWVNSHYAVFDKNGNKLLPGNGFVAGNTLFAGVGGLCETTNRGDPILQAAPVRCGRIRQNA